MVRLGSMNRASEYRRELRELRAQERLIVREVHRAFVMARRVIDGTVAIYTRKYSESRQHLDRIGRRRAILQGRLE